MCKWLGPVVARNTALLIHGHVAYSEEFPTEQRLRDVMGYEMADDLKIYNVMGQQSS